MCRVYVCVCMYVFIYSVCMYGGGGRSWETVLKKPLAWVHAQTFRFVNEWSEIEGLSYTKLCRGFFSTSRPSLLAAPKAHRCPAHPALSALVGALAPAVPFAGRALTHPISAWPVPTPPGSSLKPLIGGHGHVPLLTCGSPSRNLAACSVWVCVSPIVQQFKDRRPSY